ncbi:hypothetical protein C0Q70_16360 [Pomacea canaliculata]|uniref:Uncharacterized protein n=2 Tax=Pomacea canaliculata TaxID=400727 RepID=A0A2T7NPK2_POMCA|nr:hypothetical protein C0Q70_16360 [Pomacea canaliculata]
MRKRPLGMMGYYKGDSNHWTTYDWYRPDTRPASRQGSDVHRRCAVTPASSSPMTVEVDYDELSDDERRRHRRRRGNHGAPAGSEENEKGLSPIFTRFAENCSMQGALYILVSSSLFSKTVWSLLLIAAIGVMGLHLYQLFCTYLAYPTTNSISLGFSSLQFPAITVCNVNAVRKSQVSMLSEKFQSLVNASSPDNLASSVQNQAPSSSHGNNRRRRKREGDSGEQSFSLGGYNFGLNLDDYNEREKPTNNYYKSLPGYSSSWESEGEDATLSTMSSTFQELLASESRELRLKVGHQISDMLVSCAFSGKQCHSE